MKKTTIILAFLLSNLFVFGQENFGTDQTAKYFFATRIVVNSYGVGEYYVVYFENNQLIKKTILSYEDFILQAKGLQKSDVNYKKTDMFSDNGIEHTEIVTQLWKLRYAIYPFKVQTKDTLGWTQNFENPYMPNEKQMLILKEYGLNDINGFIWGDNLFRLLKDMESRDWVVRYHDAGGQ